MRFLPFKMMSATAKMCRLAGILTLCVLVPAEALACACGCAVFDVGSSALLPKEGDHGGVVYLEWDYSNQNTNWSGTSKAPAINDSDKNILTNWLVVGANYMINRDWGVSIRVPTASRSFLSDINFPDVAEAIIVALLLLAAPIPGAFAGDWAVAGDGCKAWNPHPTNGETIRWAGGCKDGFVEGMGTLEWQRSGKAYDGATKGSGGAAVK